MRGIVERVASLGGHVQKLARETEVSALSQRRFLGNLKAAQRT